MRVKPHHHACQSCGAKTPCSGTWEENYDGFPEVICREFHLDGGEVNHDFICDGCSCVDCGELATTTAQEATGPYTSETVKLCDSCAEKRDNYEPPEPDGEAFRGGEFAAFQAEQVEDMRRLK